LSNATSEKNALLKLRTTVPKPPKSLPKAKPTICFVLVDLLKATNTAVVKCQCVFPFSWYSFTRDKHPQGRQAAGYTFVEDQIKGPYVLAGLHCSLQKLEIQQSPSIHIFSTL